MRVKEKPLTVYPDADLRRAVARVGEDDHNRPLSKVADLALRAWIVMYDQDKYAAMKLADSFGRAAK